MTEVGPVNLGRCRTQAAALTILLDSLGDRDKGAPFELIQVTHHVTYKDVLTCSGGQIAREFIDRHIGLEPAATASVYELVLSGEAHGGYLIILFDNEEDWIVNQVFYVFA